MSALDDALLRAIAGVFVRGFDARAREIRATVGEAVGAEAMLRLRAAADLEGCAAAVAALLPADAPGTVILPPAASPDPVAGATPSTSRIMEPVA